MRFFTFAALAGLAGCLSALPAIATAAPAWAASEGHATELVTVTDDAEPQPRQPASPCPKPPNTAYLHQAHWTASQAQASSC
mgnify:CR=1 FL=1